MAEMDDLLNELKQATLEDSDTEVPHLQTHDSLASEFDAAGPLTDERSALDEIDGQQTLSFPLPVTDRQALVTAIRQLWLAHTRV